MSTTTQPDHEHPQYVTRADLEALEGRIINRMAELETRLVRDLNTAFWRQLALLLGVIAVLSGLFGILIVRLFAITDQLQATVNQLARIIP